MSCHLSEQALTNSHKENIWKLTVHQECSPKLLFPGMIYKMKRNKAKKKLTSKTPKHYTFFCTGKSVAGFGIAFTLLLYKSTVFIQCFWSFFLHFGDWIWGQNASHPKGGPGDQKGVSHLDTALQKWYVGEFSIYQTHLTWFESTIMCMASEVPDWFCTVGGFVVLSLRPYIKWLWRQKEKVTC